MTTPPSHPHRASCSRTREFVSSARASTAPSPVPSSTKESILYRTPRYSTKGLPCLPRCRWWRRPSPTEQPVDDMLLDLLLSAEKGEAARLFPYPLDLTANARFPPPLTLLRCEALDDARKSRDMSGAGGGEDTRRGQAVILGAGGRGGARARRTDVAAQAAHPQSEYAGGAWKPSFLFHEARFGHLHSKQHPHLKLLLSAPSSPGAVLCAALPVAASAASPSERSAPLAAAAAAVAAEALRFLAFLDSLRLSGEAGWR